MHRFVMQVLLAFALLCGGGAIAHAQECPEGLSAKACIELKEKALELQKKALGSDASLADPGKLNQWVDLGKNLGVALSSAAKELGTGATDFAKTGVGQLVTVVVVWKLLGKSLVLLAFTILFLFIGNGIMLRAYWRRSHHLVEVTGENGQKTRTRTANPEGWKDEGAVLTIIVWLVVNILGVAFLIAV